MKHSVLFFLHNYPNYGGIEKVTTCLANYFVSQGLPTFIFSFICKDKEKLLSYLASNVTLIQATNKTKYDATENYNQLKNIIDQHKVDTVIFQDSYAPVEHILLTLKTQLHFRLFICEHNTPDCGLLSWKYFYPIKAKDIVKRFLAYYPILWEIEKNSTLRHQKLYEECDRYILLSHKYIPLFAKVSHLQELDKLSVIYNPLTVPISNVSISSKSNTCLFCARFTSQKGIKKVLDIWCEIEQHNSNWNLIMVGDGPLMSYVKRYIHFHHLKNIILEGYRAETYQYFASSSIFLMTSIFEGWPLTLFEGMSQGCVPILYNSFAAASEMVADGKNGYVIPKFDKKQYVSKLLQLINDKKSLERMSLCAIESCKKYDIEKIGKDWIKLINNDK